MTKLLDSIFKVIIKENWPNKFIIGIYFPLYMFFKITLESLLIIG